MLRLSYSRAGQEGAFRIATQPCLAMEGIAYRPWHYFSLGSIVHHDRVFQAVSTHESELALKGNQEWCEIRHVT